MAPAQVLVYEDRESDDDPYNTAQRSVGGPPPNNPTPPVFRFNVVLKSASVYTGRDTFYSPPQ